MWNAERTGPARPTMPAASHNGGMACRAQASALRIAVITLVALATVILFCAVALGYTGRWHPAGDSFAAFRWPFAIVLAATALFGVLISRRVNAVTTGVFAVAVLAGACAAAEPLALRVWAPAAPTAPVIRIYTKNLLFRVRDVDPVVRDIVQSDADVVALQEVNVKDSHILDKLADTHPHQLLCGPSGLPVAIVSRLPVAEEFCGYPGDAISGLRVETEAGPVWVVSVHITWPWPFPQAEHVRKIAPQLSDLKGPVILAGDFNMVPWSHTVRTLERATRTWRPTPVAPTFHIGHIVGLPIDQVLIPKAWSASVERRPKFQSDHHGLLVDAQPG